MCTAINGVCNCTHREQGAKHVRLYMRAVLHSVRQLRLSVTVACRGQFYDQINPSWCIIAVCHAEINAILNKSSTDVDGCTLYVTLFPCNECARVIIQTRIRKVVYAIDDRAHQPKYQASRRLLRTAGVELTCIVLLQVILRLTS